MHEAKYPDCGDDSVLALVLFSAGGLYSNGTMQHVEMYCLLYFDLTKHCGNNRCMFEEKTLSY